MGNLQELYQRINYLREKGVKMKDMARQAGISPSILSSLYTTVLPVYFSKVTETSQDEALENALLQVNNISKKRLLAILPELIESLSVMEIPELPEIEKNPFARQLWEEISSSPHRLAGVKGLYTSYSLSSSSDCLKKEPFIICLPDNNDHIKIGRLSAYGEAQWGFGIIGDRQNLYAIFNEEAPPLFTPVTLYLQVPLFRNPRQLRGLYIGLDYNRNPIARRIILIKHSDSTCTEEFMAMESGLIEKEAFTKEQQNYYEYMSEPGDYIKMCTVPSLQMDETDLVKEKKMLNW